MSSQSGTVEALWDQNVGSEFANSPIIFSIGCFDFVGNFQAPVGKRSTHLHYQA